jgi:hypothetical protein
MKHKIATLIETPSRPLPPPYHPQPKLAVSCDGRVISMGEEQDSEDNRKIIMGGGKNE